MSCQPSEKEKAKWIDPKCVTQKPKGGPISKNAGMLCNEPEANEFAVVQGFKDLKDMIYKRCFESSRAQLDHHTQSAEMYEDLKHQYYRWAGER